LAQGAHAQAPEALRPIAGRQPTLPLGLISEELEWLIGYLEARLGSLLDYKSPEFKRSS
jgi:hypothetical protein